MNTRFNWLCCINFLHFYAFLFVLLELYFIRLGLDELSTLGNYLLKKLVLNRLLALKCFIANLIFTLL